jgi:hypothetical protein
MKGVDRAGDRMETEKPQQKSRLFFTGGTEEDQKRSQSRNEKLMAAKTPPARV